MPKERFEEALNKLEKIVSKLEQGDISLEDSLKLFEEGIRLSRFCNQKLEEAERKVEILVRDKEGVLKPEPFNPSVSSGQTLSTNPGQAPSADSEQTSAATPEVSSGDRKEPPLTNSDEALSGEED